MEIKNGIAYSKEFKESVIRDCEYRNLSKVDYAKSRNISISTLMNWLKEDSLMKQKVVHKKIEEMIGMNPKSNYQEQLENEIKILRKLIPEDIKYIDGKYYREIK